MEPIPTKLEDSLLVTFDRKKEYQMPNGYIIGYNNDGSLDGWYNVEAMIKFGSNLLKEIKIIMEDLIDVISYITKNHITYALNCGEGYIPYFEREKDTYSPWLFSEEPLSGDEKSLFESMTYRIFKNMNMSPTRLNILKILNNDMITESVSTNSITNILFKCPGEN
jgi:hypothetical protein